MFGKHNLKFIEEFRKMINNTKSIEQIEKEIKIQERELEKAKAEIKAKKAEQIRKEKARKYFNENVKVSRISDNYNIYPEESFHQLQSRFIKTFSDDDSMNVHNLKEMEAEYIVGLKTDVKDLLEQINNLEK